MTDSSHLLRWTMVAALAIPVLLLALLVLARFGDHDAVARHVARALRWVVAVEVVACAVLAIIGAVYEKSAQQRDRQLYHPPGKLVDVGGFRLHVNCMGSGGPTVILEYGHEASY